MDTVVLTAIVAGATGIAGATLSAIVNLFQSKVERSSMREAALGKALSHLLELRWRLASHQDQEDYLEWYDGLILGIADHRAVPEFQREMLRQRAVLRKHWIKDLLWSAREFEKVASGVLEFDPLLSFQLRGKGRAFVDMDKYLIDLGMDSSNAFELYGVLGPEIDEAMNDLVVEVAKSMGWRMNFKVRMLLRRQSKATGEKMEKLKGSLAKYVRRKIDAEGIEQAAINLIPPRSVSSHDARMDEGGSIPAPMKVPPLSSEEPGE